MKIFLLVIIFITLAFLNISAQDENSFYRVKNTFQIGTGRILSLFFIPEGDNESNYLTGWDLKASYGITDAWRIEANTFLFNQTDIHPVLKSLKINIFNLNAHYMMSNKANTVFLYPIMGAGLGQLSAYRKEIDSVNYHHINKNYIDINIGVGFEYRIEFLAIFADYNLKMSKIFSNQTFSPRNIGLSFGIKLMFPELQVKKDDTHKKHRKKFWERLHDRYHWF